MHLKSLTVRGFKSFASATTFDFEPGVTAVVGPNGSGKSNVVDALAWVMGEQGAKTLRGGKMEDVIFAGTSRRAPLGRAQVSLTIDNADGALPIEYSEVTISRTLFRAGGSEYAINGKSCRLLDIQELLSDSGLGREMHVIVGQGQLDRVLQATPEERRGFIEEAAGILKHRRRREKTVRKLDAMQANLTRLTDLTGELRQQLTPLGKQAEVARRAQQVQFEVRDARARLLADDLFQLTETLTRQDVEDFALREHRAGAEELVRAGRARQAELEQLAAAATPTLNALRDAWYALSAARERLRSLGTVAEERRRLLGSTDTGSGPGRDPFELERSADRVRSEQSVLNGEIEGLSTALDVAVGQRRAAEDSAAAEEERLASGIRAAADRREGTARLAGQVGAARSRVDAAVAELGRLRTSIAAAGERRQAAGQEFTVLETTVAGAEQGEERLDADYETASAALDALREARTALVGEERAAERERGALAARLDALKEGLKRRDGSQVLLDAGLDGVLTPLAASLRIAPGWESAVSAALAAVADAVVVQDGTAVTAALRLMERDDAGQVVLVIQGAADPDGPDGHRLPDSQQELPGDQQARPAISLIECSAALLAPLTALLDGVVMVEDLGTAEALVAAGTRAGGQPPGQTPGAGPDAIGAGREVTAVTRNGDVVSRHYARGGTPGAPGILEVQAAVDDTAARLAATTARLERTRFQRAGVEGEQQAAQEHAEAALARLHESDARLAAVAERLGHLGSALRSATGEAERLAQLAAAAEANLAVEEEKLLEASRRLTAVQDLPEEAEPAPDERDRLTAAAVRARQSEMEARLELRSSEERLNALQTRAASLERAAAVERTTRRQAAERARLRSMQADKALAVAQAVRRVLRFLAVSLDEAARQRDEAEEVRAASDAELAQVRTATENSAAEFSRLTDSVHRDELARAEQRLRLEALESRSIEDLGLTPDHLLAEYGPHLPVPTRTAGKDKWAELRAPVDSEGNAVPAGIPFVREEQIRRLRKAERDLAALGRVNPLALEEFTALEERHQFLSSQLADLVATRKDLLEIIREVDERVEQVFTAAFEDTAVQFERVFGRLFPGGEGRLVLADPTDLLTTGIEIEARPAGKKIRRLSLLSGGERSLTAIALLIAIFKARPSPFYVLDEVEAALDDTNLGRLISILEELRDSSQLIIITHQKRTMEVADALYGVTMRGDGVSAVISQRLIEA
ncbi:AAA family ATPase [Arthrobacter sp. Br18]|uniref:chromosome segregation SMC family protein n=1 Tax=Arthrobacter sp. Br18 TaxID=1312954 RepID=UPI00047C8FAF|nr:AAA family ATPase [Arthrobacter sp. Br18]